VHEELDRDANLYREVLVGPQDHCHFQNAPQCDEVTTAACQRERDPSAAAALAQRRPTPRARRAARALLPLLFYLGGLLLAHHEMVLTGFAFIQTDPGDTRFNNYIVEHGYLWLLGRDGHRDFWSPPFFYPARNITAYSDVLLGAAPFYWPWRIGLAPDSAFQAWMLTLTSLNFAAMYVLLRRGLEQSQLGAGIGAILFASSAPRVNQLDHIALLPQFWSLGCLYALLRLFASGGRPPSDAGRRAWIWVFFLCAAMQLWAGFYLGWFLGLALTIAGVGTLLSRGGRHSLWDLARRHCWTLVGAAAAAALVLLPMILHYNAASREVGARPFEEVRLYIPSLVSWSYMGPTSWVYAWTSAWRSIRSPLEWEHRLGLGVLTTALACAGLWMGRKDPRVRWLALVGVCLFLLTISVAGFTLWRWVYALFPGATAIRGVSRVVLILLIPVALGVSLVLTSLAAKGRGGAIVALVLGSLAAYEQGQAGPAFDKRENRDAIANIVRHIDKERCESFVFSPIRGNDPPWRYHIDAMWAQMESGVPTLNGYSSSPPPGWPLADTKLLRDKPEPTVARAIDDWVRLKQLDPSGVCWLRLPVPH
jgi:hypothetical protein